MNPSSGDLEKSPHSDPDPWEALHRHKRSWVWNQFFVLEEYTGNEPLYVGKVSAAVIGSAGLNSVVLQAQVGRTKAKTSLMKTLTQSH